MTRKEALVAALLMAVVAPDDDRSQQAIDLAVRVASGLTEHEVGQAERAVEAALDALEGDG